MEQPPTDVGVIDATPTPHPPPDGPPFPVVGIGASAGGLQALQTLFNHMPPDSDIAFVVVLHLSPDYESQAAELIQAHTAMPVAQVVDDVKLAPNHVYVIPPAKQLRMVDGSLQLAEPQTEQERRAPIDHFFRTLADTHTTRAAVIVLSGTGSDGASGLKRIKEQGGTSLVQEPQDAEFDGMPRSAIATGMVDFVLPVAAIPEMLLAFWRRGAQLSLQAMQGTQPAIDEAALREVLALVRVRTNHDFSKYKRATLLRRIGRRMQVAGVSDVATYLEVLRSRPEEVQALLGDVLISVTNFFRDRDAWTAMEAIVPLLFEGKGPGDQLRVWVTACATGEEAYSVAMLLAEHAGTLDSPPALQVFATDIDEAALSRARQGTYNESIDGDVSPERLRRFFAREKERYRVTQELRELVLFANHNVLRDPPFGKLDLITCRNLLIYLQREAQEQVLQLFHFSLRPGGYLLLGSAESVDGVSQLFDVVSKKERLFRRRTTPAALALPDVGAGAPVLSPARGAGPRRKAQPDAAPLDELHQQLIVSHAPPSVIVTADYEIAHLSAGAGRFLVHNAGAPSSNLLRAAHPDLRAELLATMVQAARQGSRGERRLVRVGLSDGARLVDVLAEPIGAGGTTGGYLFVRFVDAGPADSADVEQPVPPEQRRRLEAELARTREQLQLTVEAYETNGEEYKAANEEMTAINEELRAATEELATSKEEMQAVNEELRTVNQELKNTVEETRQANNDLQNLIAASEIATLFLDRELRLTRYTPSVERLFNLIPSDLYRPLAHVTHNLKYDELLVDAQQVLRTLQVVTREVSSTVGQWYVASMRPYRTTDDRIAGVVVTFVDITERKQAEDALRASEARQAFLLQLSDALRPLADPVEIQWEASRLLGEQLGADRVAYAEIVGDEMIVERDYTAGVPSMVGRYSKAAFGQKVADAFFHSGTYVANDLPADPELSAAEQAALRSIHCAAYLAITLAKGGALGAAFALHSATPRAWTPDEATLLEEVGERVWAAVERARVEVALHASQERLQLALDAGAMGTFVWYPANDRGEPDERMLALFGLPADGTLSLFTAPAVLIHPDDRDRYAQAVARSTDPDGSGRLREDIRVVHEDGSEHWIAATAQVSFDNAARGASRMVGIAADITNRKRAEAALRESEDRYRTLFTSIDEAFALCEIVLDDGNQPVDFRMLDVNPAFERITGIAPEQAIGHTARELIPQIEDGWIETFSRVALQGETVRFEQQAAPLGRWFDAYASPVGAPGSGTFALVFQDVSARKQAQDTVAQALADTQAARVEAEAALKTRDQFLSIASHELRTPLTSLLGYAYLLPRRATQGPEAVASLGERITLQVRRLDLLVGQLLDVSRLQQGQFALERQPLDLNMLVEQVVDAFRVTLPYENEQQIELRRPDEPLMLDADGPRLEQVLLNLLSNAVKYSQPGGPVTVNLEAEDNQAVLKVRDQGIGIPEAALARLFEPFYRASNVPPQISGFGIGLYVAQQIVQRHGGRLEAESTEGKGTTFRVVLPLPDGTA